MIELNEAILAELAASPPADLLDTVATLLDDGLAVAPQDRRAALTEMLKDRYRWAWQMSDSHQAYLHMKAVDLLEPGFVAAEAPRFPEILDRDFRASIA